MKSLFTGHQIFTGQSWIQTIAMDSHPVKITKKFPSPFNDKNTRNKKNVTSAQLNKYYQKPTPHPPPPTAQPKNSHLPMNLHLSSPTHCFFLGEPKNSHLPMNLHLSSPTHCFFLGEGGGGGGGRAEMEG